MDNLRPRPLRRGRFACMNGDMDQPDRILLHDYIVSAEIGAFPAFVGAMFVLAAGLCVLETSADTSALEAAIGFKPGTELAIGLAEFVKWYRNYYL